MFALASYVDLYCKLQTLSYCDMADERMFPEYEDKLAAPISFERALPVVGAGVQPARSADVTISNVNTALGTAGFLYGVTAVGVSTGYGDDPYGGTGAVTLSEVLTVEDIRGRRARARIIDLETKTVIFTVDGVISSPKAGGSRASLRIESRHTQAFQQMLPLRRIVDVYPNADLNGAADQDAPVIKPFGVMRKVRLIAVSEVAGAYDYGLFYKPASGTLTLNTVYREDRVVDTAEYSFVEAVPGYYVVRFAAPQRDNGQLMDIRVTVTSTEFPRHSDVVRWVLQSLGKSVNAASFTAAASTYASLGYGAPAHGLHERRRAGDILNDLLIHGASIDLNSSEEYVIVVDTLASHTDASISIGAGDSNYGNADPDSVEYNVIEDDQQVGTLKLLGSYDVGFDDNSLYLVTTTHTIPGGTVTQEEPCPYIGDSATLDREASYRAKRYRYSAESYAVQADLEARTLALGNLVPLWIPNDAVNGDKYELERIGYSAGKSGSDMEAYLNLSLRTYNADIFTYTAGTIQTSPGATSLIDYTFTPPDAPTALAFVSATPRTNAVGSVETLTVWSMNAPVENVTHLVFRAFPTGSALPLPGEAVIPVVPGQVGVQGQLVLTPGLSYSIRGNARNINNAPGFQDGVNIEILGYIPPGDTTTPPAVVSLAINQGAYKSLTFTWNATGADPNRLRNYELFIATDAGFTSVIKIMTPRSHDVSVTGLPNNTLFYARVRTVYNNGIAGGFSPTASNSTLLVQSGDVGANQILSAHIAANQIGTAHIQANSINNARITADAIDTVNIVANAVGTVKIQGDAVTVSKRQHVVTLTGSYNIVAGTAQQLNFSHALGRIPLVTVDTNDSAIASHIFALTSSAISVVLRNTIASGGATISGTCEVFFW